MKRKRLRGKALRKLQRARKAAKLLAELPAKSPLFKFSPGKVQIRLLGRPLESIRHWVKP